MVAETSFEGNAWFPPELKARADGQFASRKKNLLHVFVGIWVAVALLIYFTAPKMGPDGKISVILFMGAFLGFAYLLMSRQGGMGYSFFTKLTVKDLAGAEGKCVSFIFENGNRAKEFRLALAGALDPGLMMLETPQHVAEAITAPEKLKLDPNMINYNYRYSLEFRETPSGVLATFKESQIHGNRSKARAYRMVSYIPMSNSVLLFDKQTSERLEKLIREAGVVVKINRGAGPEGMFLN